MRKKYLLLMLVAFAWNSSFSQIYNGERSKFEQLGTLLPTPNTYRTASGAPGHQYWQQQTDYDIAVELDDEKQRITGTEKITFYNNSPDELRYLWIQLDQNIRAKNSDTYTTDTGEMPDKIGMRFVNNINAFPMMDGGFKIASVKDESGKDLKCFVNKTMMRVDLPQVLKAGEKYVMQINWSYNVLDRMQTGDRGGYEYFPADKNYIYTITQWFPRLAVYTDYQGWQHKQFLGRGEFTLPFGNYKVKITVPSDHVIASTGVLQNPQDVLTKEQNDLYEKSKKSDKPVVIVSQKEAEAREKKPAKDKKTWIYHAENVRDFAFGSSRKFIWDAQGVEVGGKTVMAMSYYPKEAQPLFGKYSTPVTAHTIKTYSKYTIDYPYPVAISVEASNGMEYPMICFNYGRPEADGTYSPRIKYGMISVIIHEVGHNFFPMIINSDERQWTWMDEGLNSFVQYMTEQEWERNYPSRRGPAQYIVDYMKDEPSRLEPIMSNSENIMQFGNNAYGKAATAMNILRETILGRELFDYAFKEYSRRWAFKHPTPADLFRTIEDASGTDLDWFWRAWFYTIEKVDISVENVKFFEIDTKNPDIEKAKQKAQRDAQKSIDQINQEKYIKQSDLITEQNPDMKDFYNTFDPLNATKLDREEYKKYVEVLSPAEKQFIDSKPYFYELNLKNIGGVVMPVILKIVYEDNTSEVRYMPAEIWRMNNNQIFKVVPTAKKVKEFQLDPYLETADTDVENNYFPRRPVPSKFEIFKQGIFKERSQNAMKEIGNGK